MGEETARTVRLSVPGQPPRKSNSRRIVNFKKKGGGNTPRLIKSEDALLYEEKFRLCTLRQRDLKLGSKTMLLRVEGDVYYRKRFVADLSIELVLDCMTKCGIIADDRYVVEIDIKKRWVDDDGGIELTVTEIDAKEYEWELQPRN